MSALVCGKRSSSSSSIFEELLHAPLSSSKRPRRTAATPAGGGATSPAATLRLSPGRPSFDRCGGNLSHLRALFPEMDQQMHGDYTTHNYLRAEGIIFSLDTFQKFAKLGELLLESTYFKL